MTTAINGDHDTGNTHTRVLAVLDARNNGCSWTEAAQRAGYTNKGSAYRAAMTYLKRNLAATAGELRAQADARHADLEWPEDAWILRKGIWYPVGPRPVDAESPNPAYRRTDTVGRGDGADAENRSSNSGFSTLLRREDDR